MTLKQIENLWNRPQAFWKHRKLIRQRKQIIAGVSIAAAAILAGVLLKRGVHRESTTATVQ